jgi:N-acetylmuramic acid 6-phosphate (MurNAc-6-P) etherase
LLALLRSRVACGSQIKTVIVALKRQVDAASTEARLATFAGSVRRAIEA